MLRDLFCGCDEIDMKVRELSIDITKKCGDIEGRIKIKFSVNYYKKELHLETEDTMLPDVENPLCVDIIRDKVCVVYGRKAASFECSDFENLIKDIDEAVMSRSICSDVDVDKLNRIVLDIINRKYYPLYLFIG